MMLLAASSHRHRRAAPDPGPVVFRGSAGAPAVGTGADVSFSPSSAAAGEAAERKLQRKPFWYLHFLYAALRQGEFDTLHRHASHLLDWPADSAALGGMSVKTLAAFTQAEAFLREGDPGRAAEAVRTMARFSRPRDREFRRIVANGPWTHLRRFPLFAVLLWSREHSDLQVSGPRFVFPQPCPDIMADRHLLELGYSPEELPGDRPAPSSRLGFLTSLTSLLLAPPRLLRSFVRTDVENCGPGMTSQTSFPGGYV